MVSFATWSVLLLAGLSAVASEGGSPATIKQFPSMLQIEFGHRHAWVQYCAGNLITVKSFVSLAHCFYGPFFQVKLRRVRAGATYRGRDGVIVGVSSVRNHPNFSILNGFNYDVAVGHLDTYLSLGPTINVISISAPGVNFPDNVPVTIAAWGRTTQDQIWADRELRSNRLYTVSRDSCKKKYGDLPIPITITDTMLCSRLPHADGQKFGLRDAGSAIIYENVLVGLACLGSPYDDKHSLVATDVSSVSNWIVYNSL